MTELFPGATTGDRLLYHDEEISPAHHHSGGREEELTAAETE